MTLFGRRTCQAIRLGARALAAGRVEMAVTGLEHIPTDGPVLLVARHYHHFFDGVVLLVSIPRPIHILVTLDWAKNSYARRLVTRGKVFTAAAIRRSQRSALSDSVALLTQGRVLVVFPEGYPNIDPTENESGVSSI